MKETYPELVAEDFDVVAEFVALLGHAAEHVEEVAGRKRPDVHHDETQFFCLALQSANTTIRSVRRNFREGELNVLV